ncbi:CaiB/BaiF CoA transferase family protein [Phenylobacterium sp.]|uniref:CaiB/BaiF CoA transferase family protein n=1 Tax=Phenylobacterium sp. TaxID=1871053 RepID=UPI0035B39B92
MPAQNFNGVFEGVSVLCLAEQYPGPFATMLLADLGADVVLVERPRSGDPARAFPAFFAAMGRNKRSICLNLKSESGQAQFLQLARRADVLLEGYRPGVMERLGLGYPALAKVNPRLVYASISGFGQTGPYRDRVAHDLSYQAIAGLLFDKVDRTPSPPATSLGDLAGAMFAAFGIASALFARERTGSGTFIDVSMTDGLVSWMTAYLGPALNGERPFEILSEPAYGAFVCADGKVLTLSIAHEDHFWRQLCELLGLDHLADLQGTERIARGIELRGVIGAWIAKRPLAKWAELFDKYGIPWSPLHRIEDVIRDPHFTERGLFVTSPGSETRAARHVRQPLAFSHYRSVVNRPAPRIGEHTDEVIAEWRKKPGDGPY